METCLLSLQAARWNQHRNLHTTTKINKILIRRANVQTTQDENAKTITSFYLSISANSPAQPWTLVMVTQNQYAHIKNSQMLLCYKPLWYCSLGDSHLIYSFTVRVIGAPQMISQPVSSIFPCASQDGDRPGVRQVPEGSGEQGKMEKSSCKIICGAPATLAVKRLMTMMYVCACAVRVCVCVNARYE